MRIKADYTAVGRFEVTAPAEKAKSLRAGAKAHAKAILNHAEAAITRRHGIDITNLSPAELLAALDPPVR